MTSSIGLNWTQEDGLSMLTLESSTLDPHHHHHYPQSRKQFYYRLFDIDCPFRFTLRSVLGDALDGNFAIFKASVVVEGFTLDSIEDGHFGEVVEMQLKYSDLVPGCSLNLTIEDVEDDDNSAFRVQFDLFESDTGLRQGQFKIPLVLQNPENSTLLHMEKTLKLFEEDPNFQLVPWMDEIVCEQVRQLQLDEARNSSSSYLFLELQRFDHPVMFVGVERPLQLLVTKGRQGLKQLNCSIWQPKNKTNREILPIPPNLRMAITGLVEEKPFTWHLVSDERILIWKYRHCLVVDNAALMMFIKSVDWIDEEEVLLVIDLLRMWAPLEPHQVLELLCLRQPSETTHKAILWEHIIKPALKSHRTAFKPLLPQLVQSLLVLHEGSQDDFYPDQNSLDPLNFFTSFLIDLAMDDLAFSTRLFWYLRVASRSQRLGQQQVGAANNQEAGFEDVFSKFQGLFLGSLSQLPEGAAITEQLYQQVNLFGRLENLLVLAKKQRSSRQQKLAMIMESLDNPSNGFLTFAPIPLPLDTDTIVTGILADRTVLFKSNALPLKLFFVATDREGVDVKIAPIIFKEGDDLRQDQLVLDLIALIDNIWRRNRLDLRLTPYKVVSTAINTGLVEFVPSLPLSTILDRFNGSLKSYFRYLSSIKRPATLRQDDFDTLPINPEILGNYLRSSAGYSVLTYVLGIGDRHLENLLLTETGKLFHVDFTYAFGRDPKPFPPPMKLCREMVEAMQSSSEKRPTTTNTVSNDPVGMQSFEFGRFKSLCFTAFCLLRRNARELLACIALLKHTGTTDFAVLNPTAGGTGSQAAVYPPPHPSIEPGLSISKAVLYVQERLMLDVSEEEALRNFDQLIEESVTALFPQVMETIHKWAQYWRA